MPGLEEIKEIGTIAVSIEKEEQLFPCLKRREISRVYIDEAAFSEEEIRTMAREIKKSGKEAGLRFRRIVRREDRGIRASQWLQENRNSSLFAAFLFRTLDQVFALQEEKERNYFAQFDYPLYSYNSRAMEVWKAFQGDSLTFPIEFNYREDCAFSEWAEKNALSTELLIYGRLPMMVTANCIEKTRNRCTKSNETIELKDRQNKTMPVRLYCKFCYNQIFNADIFSLFGLEKEIANLRPKSLRLDFTTESRKEVEEILRGKLPRNFTRGHFHKGIE